MKLKRNLSATESYLTQKKHLTNCGENIHLILPSTNGVSSSPSAEGASPERSLSFYCDNSVSATNIAKIYNLFMQKARNILLNKFEKLNLECNLVQKVFLVFLLSFYFY